MPLLQSYGALAMPNESAAKKRRKPASYPRKRGSRRDEARPAPTLYIPAGALSDGARRNACPECQRPIANSVWYSSDDCPYCHTPLAGDSLSDNAGSNSDDDQHFDDDEDDLTLGKLRHLQKQRAKEREAKEIAAKPVARWMAEEFQAKGLLYQSHIALEIEKRFGKQFLYRNNNGNRAISRIVLAEFEKLTLKSAIWDRSNYFWRRRRPEDDEEKRFVK